MLDGVRFVPGDIVEWTNLGLRLVGRVSDFVNIAGKKVHPAIIEEHLQKLPGVIDAIVFGIPSANRNEDLVAYVVASTTISRQLLESHCREGLSSWQVPREFQIVAELPFNQRGKINRSELSRLHLESRATEGPKRIRTEGSKDRIRAESETRRFTRSSQDRTVTKGRSGSTAPNCSRVQVLSRAANPRSTSRGSGPASAAHTCPAYPPTSSSVPSTLRFLCYLLFIITSSLLLL